MDIDFASAMAELLPEFKNTTHDAGVLYVPYITQAVHGFSVETVSLVKDPICKQAVPYAPPVQSKGSEVETLSDLSSEITYIKDLDVRVKMDIDDWEIAPTPSPFDSSITLEDLDHLQKEIRDTLAVPEELLQSDTFSRGWAFKRYLGLTDDEIEDTIAEPWFAPAGLNRGNLKGYFMHEAVTNFNSAPEVSTKATFVSPGPSVGQLVLDHSTGKTSVCISVDNGHPIWSEIEVGAVATTSWVSKEK